MELDVWHVTPINDLYKHIENGTVCPCSPYRKTVENCTIIVHNSFDGREGLEMAKEILKLI